MTACLGPALLERYADQTCSADETVAIEVHLTSCADCRGRVQSQRADSELLAQLRDAVEGSTVPAAAEVLPGVPGFRVLDVLGVGGMGVVYAAEQAAPRRRVALKVLRGGLPSPSTLRRFELEREVLARLEHPGIARIHAAGTYVAGGEPRPFFAMELVHGERLDLWLRRAAPGRNARLELFVAICAAVEHAHRRGVVHRDLKPGNVLVTAEGQVKVVDFGVARLIDREGIDPAEHTQVDHCVGTLPYMSPEQLESGVGGIDTRTDVWALGVLLFEMLTGQLPHDLGGLSRLDAARRISEGAPRRLGHADRSLRGELQTIVGKALRREPDERYASAGALGDDIGRYLRREPVAAHPPSAWYLARKFATRHRLFAGAAALVLVAFVTAFGVARSERDAAVLQARRSEAIVDILKEVLLQADPKQVIGQEPTIRDAVREAEVRMRRHVPDDPWVEAVVRHTLAKVQLGLGEYDDCEQNLERALVAFREAVGDGKDVVAVLGDRGALMLQRAQFDGAEAVSREALALARRFDLGAAVRAALSNQIGLACQALGRLDEAEQAITEALRGWRSIEGASGANVGAVLANLGLVHSRRDQPAATRTARAAYAESLQILERELGPDHPLVAATHGKIGALEMKVGELDAAAASFQRALEIGKARLGPGHPELTVSYINLGSLRRLQERHDEAAAAFADATAAARRKGPAHPHLMAALSRSASALLAADRAAEALVVLQELVERLAAARGPEHESVLVARARCAAAAGGDERDARLQAIEDELNDRIANATGDAGKSLRAALARVHGLRGR